MQRPNRTMLNNTIKPSNYEIQQINRVAGCRHWNMRAGNRTTVSNAVFWA